MRLAQPGLGERAFRLVGGLTALASCLPMLIMLPAGFGGALGLLGIKASSGAGAALGEHLSSVARPLLLVATALVAVGGLRCSRLAVFLAAGGGILLYLSMYVWMRPDGTTAPALFYPGLALFLASFVVGFAWPRLRRCRPLLDRRLGQRLSVASLAAGGALVGAAAAFGFGAASVSSTAGAASPAHRASAGMSAAGNGMGSMNAMTTTQATTAAPTRTFVVVRPGRLTWDAMLRGLTAAKKYQLASNGSVRLQVRGLFPSGMVTVRVRDAAGRTVFAHAYSSANEPAGAISKLSGAPGRWTISLAFTQAGGGPFRIDAVG